MLRLTASWLIGIRHALVAVAVLATLASAFGFHLHTGGTHEHHDDPLVEAGHDHHDHSDQVATKFTGELTGDDAGGLGTELDPDGCGHCHCQLSATDLPFIAGSLTIADHITELLTPRDQLIRDGVTYQPDPPPVQG